MTGEKVGVTGRVIFFRNTGKLCFATLREGDAELQVMLSRDRVGEEALAAWKADVDLGDHVLVDRRGRHVAPRRAVGVRRLLAADREGAAAAAGGAQADERGTAGPAALRRPDRARRGAPHRPPAGDGDVARCGPVSTARGFLEVETPMLQTVHGGAAARPFRTHMNAFDLDLYLRIAPELFLKRCIVGGLDRVFEINRNFRNEGADSSHSPEFAMLETYQAYADYQVMATLTRELIQECCAALFGDHVARHHDGTEVDLSGEWPQIPLYTAVSEAVGERSPRRRRSRRCARSPSGTTSASTRPGCPGKVVEELFEALVQHTLQSPTFVIDYPLDTSPLTRAHRSEPGLAEKWDLYIGGIERATAYSELVDPVSQRERFTAQAVARRRRRPRGHGAGRGLPRGARIRDAADRRHGYGYGSADDDAHRSRNPGDHPVPAGQANFFLGTGPTRFTT